MQIPELILLLAGVMLATNSVSAQSDLRYVMPNDSSPPNCPGQPCLTLDQYTQQTQIYFTTGSTFVFLAGNHSLQTQILLKKISDLTLRGEGNGTAVTIICRNGVTVRTQKAANLTLDRLNFVLYSSSTIKLSTAIQIISSKGIKISSLNFIGTADLNKTLTRAISLRNSNIEILKCIFDGSTGKSGGAIEASKSNISITGTVFIANKARDFGGAISTEGGFIHLKEILGNIFTQNSAQLNGGAIYCERCSVYITSTENTTLESSTSASQILTPGATYFTNNTAITGSGGALSLKFDTALYLSGTSIVFANNEASHDKGGAINLILTSLLLAGVSIKFTNNKADQGGAICLEAGYALLNATKLEVKDNLATDGGGIYLINSGLTITSKQIHFISNTAQRYGGAIAATIDFFHKLVIKILSGVFINNVGKCGGAIYFGRLLIYMDEKFYISLRATLKGITFVSNSESAVCASGGNITFRGVTKIAHNTGISGGGININDSLLSFRGYTVFDNNNASNGGAIKSVNSSLSFSGETLFMHNTGTNGGALHAELTDVIINSVVRFTENFAQNGGAMYLTRSTSVNLNQHTNLTTSHNYASHYGGAIYHNDQPAPYLCDLNNINENYPECFLQLNGHENKELISSYFDSAGRNGSFLYGGLLDKCRLHVEDTLNSSITPYDYLMKSGTLNIVTNGSTMNAITSKLYGICFCDKNTTCDSTRNIKVYRGQKFIVPIKAIAQGGTYSDRLTAQTSLYTRVKLSQVFQNMANSCTNLEYNFYSTEDYQELRLTTNGLCGDFGIVQAVIGVTLLPCPSPFVQSDEDCVCEERLLEYHATCITDEHNISYVVQMPGAKFWMKTLYDNQTYQGLIIYKICPIEYCKVEAVSIPLHDLDFQCDFNRGGLLCGACVDDTYSLMFGSSKCQVCSNTYLALILPFAASGLALVVFLSFLRMTVATGMINSLILYANIVQVNKHIFFPVHERNTLTIFIAWLNFDLGFETCFYDGMDAYAQTWFQFAFPLYVWILISLIILSSRYSITVSKLIGSNPIAVLATLLLMSYTKILKIIIEVYSSVELDYPDNKAVPVWLKDANVPYLQSKHLLLTALATLILVFLFLPYTLLLLLGYKVYRFSGRKHLHWLNKIKPLLDSYYAPYKTHTRYWTGFLLLVRCALYIVFSYNSLGATHESLLAINITFTAIVVIAWLSIKVYKRFITNVIEASIYLNLVSLSAAALANKASPALVYSMVGVVFVTMIAIIVYHFHITYSAKSATWLKIKAKITSIPKTLIGNKRDTQSSLHNPVAKSSHDPHKIVTKTVIDLREPVLENSN